MAGRVTCDHPPRASAPRCAAEVHRSDGHRFQATLTDLPGDMVEIERLHRGRGDAENLVRGAKQTGLENLPFREFALNAVWLELSLIAQDLIAWTQRLCLEGELAICEPKAIRYRLLHTAGRLRSTPAARSCASQRTGHGPSSSPPLRTATRAASTRRLTNLDRAGEHNDRARPGAQTPTVCCRANTALNPDGSRSDPAASAAATTTPKTS